MKLLALGNGLNLEVGLKGHVDGDLGLLDIIHLEIVLQGNDTIRGTRGSGDPLGDVTRDPGGVVVGGITVIEIPVIGVMVPHDGLVTHGVEDTTDTVINVTVWRTDVPRGDTNGLTDSTGGVSELGDDLLIGLGGEGGVGPGVGGNMMALLVGTTQDLGIGEDTGSDDEEGGLDVVLFKKVQEDGGIGGGSIIVGQTPLGITGAIEDVSDGLALSTRPPALAGGNGGGGTRRTPTSGRSGVKSEVGD